MQRNNKYLIFIIIIIFNINVTNLFANDINFLNKLPLENLPKKIHQVSLYKNKNSNLESGLHFTSFNKSSNIILDLNLKEAKEKELFLNKNIDSNTSYLNIKIDNEVFPINTNFNQSIFIKNYFLPKTNFDVLRAKHSISEKIISVTITTRD